MAKWWYRWGGWFYWGIVFFALALSGCVESVHQGADPAKMAEVSIPASWRTSSAVVLDWSTDLEFIVDDAGNRVKEREDKWYRILNTDGYDLQYITVVEHKEIEKPPRIRARAYYPDGSEWVLPQRGIVQNEGDFADITVHSFYVPKYQKDLLIHITVERDYVKPEFVGRYFLADDYGIVQREIALRYPQEASLTVGLENSGDERFEESIATENGIKEHTVTAYNVTDFREQERTPYPEEYYAAFYLSLPPQGLKSYSWQQLGDYYLQSYEKQYSKSPAIQELSAKISAEASPAKVVRNSFEAVVDKVRYHFDSRGGYAFVPRDPAAVLENGYGDCKELSTILKAVLAERGMTGHPTLVTTWNSVQPLAKYPTLSGFNHMILALEKGGAQLQFLDPTMSWSVPDESYYPSIGRRAFLVEPGKSRIVTITGDHDFENRVITTSRIHFDRATGSWVLAGQIDLTGFAAQRFYEELQHTGRKDDRGLATEMLNEGFEIYPKELEVVQVSPLKISVTYSADFEEQYLPLNEGGLKLSVPSLYKRWVKRDLPDKLGPVFLNRYIQEDRWELPFAPTDSQLVKDSNTIASSEWSTEQNVITRRYVQNETRRALADAGLKSWDSKIDEIVNSVVWK